MKETRTPTLAEKDVSKRNKKVKADSIWPYILFIVFGVLIAIAAMYYLEAEALIPYFLLGVIITALFYLSFPLIRLWLNHGKFEPMLAKRIALWNAIIVEAILITLTAVTAPTVNKWNILPAFFYYGFNKALLTDASTFDASENSQDDNGDDYDDDYEDFVITTFDRKVTVNVMELINDIPTSFYTETWKFRKDLTEDEYLEYRDKETRSLYLFRTCQNGESIDSFVARSHWEAKQQSACIGTIAP